MSEVLVRKMREADLAEAALICRVAFGTFFGLPEPDKQGLDRDYVGTRWRANPDAALVAERDGALVGSNFATHWGSFAFFGPLTIRPEYWNQGIAQKLLAPTMDLFDAWGVSDAGLFTFAQSAKHVALYQKFGFWPGFLTALMFKPVQANPWKPPRFRRFSELSEEERTCALAVCRDVAGAILNGLDVSLEICSVRRQSLGDTVLIDDAFAICHCGAGTEAGTNGCYIKFAAVRPGPNAEKTFDKLLDACESLAAERGLDKMEAGVNLGRRPAYQAMIRHGYRTQTQGVAMHKPDRAAYNRPDVFVIDDWR
jgi:GNAT superfamily N-acetyltransferase